MLSAARVELDLGDHPPARLGLEATGAVAEPAFGGGQVAHGPVAAVVGAHPGDDLGDFLAVRAYVLDRGRPTRPGIPAEALDPAKLDGHIA